MTEPKFVDRWRIEDNRGRYLTPEGHFTSVVEDALEFDDEEEAIAVAKEYDDGCTAEHFSAYR